MKKKIPVLCAFAAICGLTSAASAVLVSITSFQPPLSNVATAGNKTFDGGLWTAVYSPGWVNVAGSWPSTGSAPLTGAARNFSTNQNQFLTLTADPGYELLLKSFQMIDGGSGNPTSVGLRSTAPTVAAAAPTYDIWSTPANSATFPQGVAQTFTLDETAPFTTSNSQWTRTNLNPVVSKSGYRDSITIVLRSNATASAMDNIFFDLRQVPEPASLSLLALGGLAMLRRRHA